MAFLAGGGALGTIIGEFDWAATSLGPIGAWPERLKTTTAIVLHSPVPMALLWGPDGILIYNDAYAGIAGQRHPRLLGSKVLEGWPEMADLNRHVLEVVLAGGSLAYKNQELTLYRAGEAEQVWMDLNYSPVPGEDGRPVGVVAIVAENTQKVLGERKTVAELEGLTQMFEQAPGFIALLAGPEHRFELANSAYRQLVRHRDVVGKTVREALPEIESQGFLMLLDQVYRTGETFVGKAREVDLQPAPGMPAEKCFVDFVYQPLRDADGTITRIFVEGSNVTRRVRLEMARAAEKRALELAVAAAPLPEVLAMLVRTAESSSEDAMLGSILLLDRDGVHLRDGAGPNLPQAYRDAIDGLPIGPQAGSCGTAAFRKQAVHVSDIEKDPLWADYRELALRHGLRACWSTPVLSARGQLLGTFAMYYRQPQAPRAADLEMVEVVTRTAALVIERKRSEQALRESEARFRKVFEYSNDAICLLDPERDAVLEANPAAVAMFGYASRDAFLATPVSAFLPDDASTIRKVVRGASGERSGWTGELTCRGSGGASIDTEMSASTLTVNGRRCMLALVRDIGERKRAERHRKMLLDELNHRVKNTLASVQAIAAQTFRDEAGDARAAFEARLFALSSAHSLLTSQQWEGVELRELALRVLDPFMGARAAERFHLQGGDVLLPPKAALAISMALHELASNAAKYGALSVGSHGRVELSWATADGRLRLRWEERDGPPVVPPTRKGFGSRLIQAGLAHELEGTATLDCRREGLVCEIDMPEPAVSRRLPDDNNPRSGTTATQTGGARDPENDPGPGRSA
ncbi:MAG TPA: PAS domain S-box protein [Rhodanobacteraceae bacterium]|nr:PAS domain S-box protein [Rhodanobacteraceae bacterium]